MELLLTGDPIDAHEAKEWGLVNRVVPADHLDDRTAALAKQISLGSKQVVADTKRALYRAVAGDRESAYEHARDVMARSSAAPDAQEGIAAFLEKREPVWPSEAPPQRSK